MSEDELRDWRIKALEDARRDDRRANEAVVAALGDLGTELAVFRTKVKTWGSMLLLVHPLLVGLILKWAVTNT